MWETISGYEFTVVAQLWVWDRTDDRGPHVHLERYKDAGLTKSICVSNFNCKQLERILTTPGLKYKPVCNQVSMGWGLLS